MLKPEQVPDEVWSVFHEAVLRYGYKPQALAAALNAWPGAFPWTFTGPLEGHGYVLPLRTEASDDPQKA